MALNTILLPILIIMCLMSFGEADKVNTSSDVGLTKKYTNFNLDNCAGNKCVFKCCPYGQFIYRRQCVDNNTPLDFSKLKVYDKKIYETGRFVPEVFPIVPAKYDEDPDFRTSVININKIGYNTYLTESGVLQLEMPNVYQRWTAVQNANFCIDFLIDKTGVLETVPTFWAHTDDTEFAESNIYLTGATLVSCFFLLLVLTVYFLLPELQNLCGRILMAYVGSLFMAFLLLATVQLSIHSVVACLILTFGIYFFFLATFCWMSVMSYDIWWTFRGYAKARPIHRRGEQFKFGMYCLYAWGVPFLMTCGLAYLNTANMKSLPWFITPHIPSMGCFLEGGVKMLYLYMPMMILIVCNWLFYLMTAFNVWRLSRGTAVLDSAAAGTPAAHRTHRHRFMVYLKLSVVMGLNWVLEIVSFIYPGFKFWYITDLYNILLGLAIFLIFVCKKKIFRMLCKRYGLKKVRRFYPGSSNKSYSSSNSDSSQETTTLQVCVNPKGQNSYATPMRSL